RYSAKLDGLVGREHRAARLRRLPLAVALAAGRAGVCVRPAFFGWPARGGESRKSPAPSFANAERRAVMLTREHVETVVRLCTERADFAAFQAQTAPGFIYEFMGTQPYAGEWHGADAVKRQFTAFNDNFTSEFQVTATEIYVDAEKQTAAVRLRSHPLTDK